jgi:hypothetical protein
MRRTALTLLLTLASLAFAPAPFPKAQRRPQETEESRATRRYDARLRELVVSWELRTGTARKLVRFEVRNRRTLEYAGHCEVGDGGLPAALEAILDCVQHQIDRRK